MPLDELADLGAEAVHHLQHGEVGRPRLVAEKLQNAQALAAQHDRHGKGWLQAVFLGGRLAGRIVVAADFGNPRGLPSSPYATRKPDTPLEGKLLG